MIYDFSHMFICLLWFCHRLPKGEIVRTYVNMLGTYVNIKLARSRMCLMLQGTRFQVQVLKPYKSVQKTSEEVLDFKTRQIASIEVYKAV